MTVEEKLKHFFDSSIEDAHKQSQKAIEEYKEVLDKEFENYKINIDSLAANRLKMEETRITRDMNHDLSDSLLLTRKELSDKHYELKEALFEEVKEMLTAFRTTKEYKQMLVNQIKKALEFAEDDKLTIYIDPDDETLIPELKKDFIEDFVISEYGFGGGIRAIITEKGILIDNSFDTRYNEILKDFTFNGGSSND